MKVIGMEGYFGELNQKQVRYIQNVSNSGRHLLNLINDILDISKVEAGKMKLFPECIPVDSMLEEMIALVQPLAAKKEISISVSRDPKLETLLADKAKIKQILYNLLGNAIKFTHINGTIEVTTQISNHTASIIVRDNGIGMRPEIIKNLHENRVVLVDIPDMSERSELFVLSIITRRIMERHRSEARGFGIDERQESSHQVLITIEEAQRVLASGGSSTQVFRECAMEGRKFGVGLCV
ncbi:MAG: hypothetical protein HGA85_01875, partial [Nanoarchaeota archaeon]|nr:hypothetical protein [Nanoarchaeota archaeon]